MDPEQNSTTENASQIVKQEAEEASQMTPQLVSELCVLLTDQKKQVKYATINAILQHTKTEAQKLLFLQTNIFSQLIQCMKIQDLKKICLSTLIHFSSCENCAQKIVQFVQPIVMDLRVATGLVEELGLLLILNLSKIYEFTNKLIQEKGNTTQSSAIVLEILFSFLEGKPSRRWVIANIFVNISSHDVGRQYIAKQKLYLSFLKYINDEKQSLRLATLRILRNISFLWQQQQIITQLLKGEYHIIDNISIHILIMILKSQLCSSYEQAIDVLKDQNYSKIVDYDMQIEPELPRIVTSKQKSINQIQICVDIILILSNAEFPKRKPEFWKDGLKKMISLVNFTEVKEEVKDKLQALQTFCFW